MRHADWADFGVPNLPIAGLGVGCLKLSDLQAKAATGDTNAQVALGIAYRDGRGVGRRLCRSRVVISKAAEKNDAAALDNLAWMCEHGLGTRCSLSRAVRYYRASAELGHAQAQWNWDGCTPAPTGESRSRGGRSLVPPGRGERAPQTQYELGLAYLQGMGVAADDAQASAVSPICWAGNGQAALAVGWMYCLGRSLAADEQEARAWFAKAAHPHSHRTPTLWSGSTCAKGPPLPANLFASMCRMSRRGGIFGGGLRGDGRSVSWEEGRPIRTKKTFRQSPGRRHRLGRPHRRRRQVGVALGAGNVSRRFAGVSPGYRPDDGLARRRASPAAGHHHGSARIVGRPHARRDRL